jgi:peptidoglycan/xylan/chitin deacetylase (PgdA/CDA1 family)
MRIDRFLTLAFFYPAIKLLCRNSAPRIAILMYHGISKQLDDNLHPYFRTVTSPEHFEQQMSFLSENGYQVLTLSEALHLMQKRPVSPNSNKEAPVSFDKQRPIVVITFDDGLQDFYGAAFPVLEKFGFKATVFLTSGLIDKTFLTGSECLRKTEIRELANKGIEFGSHTVSHPQLKGLSNNEVVNELANSKKQIEEILGNPIALFSYPYRFPEEDTKFTKMLGVFLLEQGYTTGVTTIIGCTKTNDNPLFLKRLPVNDCDDRLLFQAKLEGGYDWLHAFQLISKKVRSLIRKDKADVFNPQSNC